MNDHSPKLQNVDEMTRKHTAEKHELARGSLGPELVALILPLKFCDSYLFDLGCLLEAGCRSYARENAARCDTWLSAALQYEALGYSNYRMLADHVEACLQAKEAAFDSAARRED